MEASFHPYSAQHVAVVAVGSALMAGLIVLGRAGGRKRQAAAAVLAFCNLSAYPLSQAAWLSYEAGKSLDNVLPLHLCDVAAVIAGFALITRKPLLQQLTYFWGLAATVQALVTPAITVGFPHAPFVMFFVQHFAVVGAALFLPLVDGWRPKKPWWKSPLEAYFWSLVYLFGALAVNGWLKTNFGFVSRPPETASLIDYLGPWPWYLFSLQALALGVFCLLALPFSGTRAAAGT